MLFPIVIMQIEDYDDRKYMECLYIENRYLMFKVAYDIAGIPDASEDIVSEAIIALIRNIDTIRGMCKKKLKTYIVSVVKNKAYDYLRKKKAVNKYVSVYGFEDTEYVDDAGNVDDELLRDAELSMLKEAMNKLDERDKYILRMKYYDMLDDDVIADKIGIGTSSVRYYLTLARRKLKEKIQNEEK